MQIVGVPAGFLRENFPLFFYFDHFQDFGFGTTIDGTKGESVRAKVFRWAKLIGPIELSEPLVD